MQEEVRLRDLEPGDGGWVIMRHAELYAEEAGFDASFEPLVAGIIADFQRTRQRPTERAWIALRGRQRLGSIFCVKAAEDVAQLRLFLVEPSERGTGLGRRLLTQCVEHARAQGAARMVLWTHKSHEAACALYARSGFAITLERPVHNFGRDLIEQCRERTFANGER